MTYERAYRIIAGESRRCFERNVPGATVNVNADLYSETKFGEISISGALLTSSVAEVLFELHAVDAKTSEIRTYYRKKSSKSVERAMQAWLEGNSSVCHVEQP